MALALSRHSKAPKPPVPLACLACRQRHWKCDGRKPCSRCVEESRPCEYAKSRRGYKGPRRVKISPAAALEVSVPDQSLPSTPLDYGPWFQSGGRDRVDNVVEELASPDRDQIDSSSFDIGEAFLAGFAHDPDVQSMSVQEPINTNIVNVSADQKRDIASFYRLFHPHHPFLVPYSHWHISPIASDIELLKIVCMTGAFIGGATSELATTLKEEATTVLTWASLNRTGIAVQTMLLYAIVLHGITELELSSRMLARANELALSLGMNFRAWSEACDDVVHRESWRRTWWELYAVGALVATGRKHSTFHLDAVFTDVPLPCEEKTFSDRKALELSSGTHASSSFAVRIEAFRVLARILPCQTADPASSEWIAADTLLANWRVGRDVVPRTRRSQHMCDPTSPSTLWTNFAVINSHNIFRHDTAMLITAIAPVQNNGSSTTTPPTPPHRSDRHTFALSHSVDRVGVHCISHRRPPSHPRHWEYNPNDTPRP